MKKKLALLTLSLAFVFTLAGCWQGEVYVETTFDMNGGGERVYQLTVIDDTLSDEPIDNPDDPDGVKETGAVLNDKHIEGGVPAIQDWLEDNAPSFMEVHDMETDGYNRIFTLSYAYDDFDGFLDGMKDLVNASPNMSWDDFDAEEHPTFDCEGLISETCTFSESKVIVEASMDWAIDGIYTDIYDEADLAGFVEKADIATLSDYKVTLGDNTYEEYHEYDPEADYPDNEDHDGRVVYIQSETLGVSDEGTNWMVVAPGAGVIVLILGGIGFILYKKRV